MLRALKKTVPLRRASMWALVAGIYSLVPLARTHFGALQYPDLPWGFNAVLSFVLVLLIGFRVNRSYDRWWEARKLWGSLVNASRNLAIKIRVLLKPDADEGQLVRNLLVSFSLGLKDHLCDESDLCKLPGFEEDKSNPHHLPSYIVRHLYTLFDKWQADAKLGDAELWVLDSEARVLLEVCGGCERIKNTMISQSWRVLTRQVLFLLVILLPWGLVSEFGVLMVPLTIVITYFLVAAEFIAQAVETPFGGEEDHLDLDGICLAIDRSVSELLADSRSA